MEEHFIIEEDSLEFIIDDKVKTIHAGSYVMIHAGTKHDIKVVTDCKMIMVGCAV